MLTPHAPLSSSPAAAPPSLRTPTLALLAALLLFDATGLDMPLAQLFGTAAGFALKDHWWLEKVFHSGGRTLAWAIGLWLCAGVWWPVGVLRRLDEPARVRLALTTVLAVLAVSALKAFSTTSCPWDLAAFGRTAAYVSHWDFMSGLDGGSGRCFPAGQASSGFCFVGGFFAFRHVAPGLARRWLQASVAAGLVLGLAQQARGAHFMSHTLWTGAVCWCVALAVDAVGQRRQAWARVAA